MLLEQLKEILLEGQFDGVYYDHYKNEFENWWSKVEYRLKGDTSIKKVLRHWYLNNIKKVSLSKQNKILKLEIAGSKAVDWYMSKGGREHANYLKTRFSMNEIPIWSSNKKDNRIYIAKPEAKFNYSDNGYIVKPLFIKNDWALVEFIGWFNKSNKSEKLSTPNKTQRSFGIIKVNDKVNMNSVILLDGNGIADYSLGEISINSVDNETAYFNSGHQIFGVSNRYAAKEAKQLFGFILKHKPELLPWFELHRDPQDGKLKIREKNNKGKYRKDVPDEEDDIF